MYADKEKAKEYARSYYQRNKAKWEVKKGQWALANPEANRECKRHYRERNKAKRKAYNKTWAQKNAGKVTAYSVAYQLSKKRAMPQWLTPEQVKDIEAIYANRPKGYHVDHVVPLNGKNVCGLHVGWNLQYLLKEENIKKSNKLTHKPE